MSEFKAPGFQAPASGWHAIDDPTYFGMQAFGSSELKRALKSPAHVHGSEMSQSSAMALGGAFHLFTLVNPALVVSRPDFNMRTNAGKDDEARWRAQLPPGTVSVSLQDHEAINRMYASIHEHKFAKAVFAAKDGVNEVAGVVNEGGPVRRIKPDRRIPSKRMIVDVKTTSDASGDCFARDATKYRYWLQAAFYLDVANEIEALLNTGVKYELFLFVVVESKPPYGVRVFEVERSGIELGRDQYTEAWKRIVNASASGVWSKYPQQVEVLTPPPYAMYEDLT